MTKIFCDVCEEEMVHQEGKGLTTRAFSVLKAVHICDVCPDCADAANAIDWPAHLLAAARRASPRVPEEGEP